MARRVSSPLTVGRTDTQAALDAALAQASEGEPQLVLVAGEAGIGKTRMASELAGRAIASGHRVLWGECVPMQAGELPYAPFAAALRGVEGAEALLAELHGGGGAATPQAPARLFELLLRELGRLTETTPALFVVEDVHWADTATQDALRFLARNLRDERLLLLLTLRTDEPDVAPSLRGLVGELARGAHGERLDLARLTLEDTAAQVAAIVEAPTAPALAAWVHDRAEGNPYFAEELLAVRESEGALPDSLRDVLLARMAGVEGPPRQVLRVAAAAGRDIDHELLERAAGLDGDALGAALRQLVGAHVFVSDRTAERYRFRHALAREAVYGELLPPERRALHRALARALEASVPEPDRGAAEWAALAQHWEGAHDEAAALRASVAAAAAAHDVYAFQAARSHLDRARRLWPRVEPGERPDGLDEVELLQRLADTMRLEGDRDAAVAVAESALARAGPERAAAVHIQLGTLLRERERAIHELERGLELLPPGPSRERATAMAWIGKHMIYGELPSHTHRFALEALEVARAAGATEEEGIVHLSLGVAFANGGDGETGFAHYREAIRIARELGRGDRVCLGINNYAWALATHGRLDEAIAVLETGLEEARAFGVALSDGVVMQESLVECELRVGRWAAAGARLERLRAATQERELRLELSGLLAVLRARQGNLAAAAELDREAASLSADHASPGFLVQAATGRAEVALLRGDPAAARAIVRDTFAAVPWGGIIEHPNLLIFGVQAEADLAERARAAGRADEVEHARTGARELYRALRFYEFEAPVAEPVPPETRARFDEGEAELARLDGAPRGELWARAAEGWEGLRFPYNSAYARLREAEARLASGGDRAAAAAALRAAHAELARLGAAPLRGQAEALARRARIPLAGAPDAERPFDLTERELTVLERLAAGQTNRQIAEELFLSTRTVDMHVRNILVKLGAANRVEAAATAHRLGLRDGTAVLP